MMSDNTHDFVPEVSDEERQKRERSGIMALVQSVVQKHEENWTAELAGELEKYQVPNRSALPEVYREPKEHQGITRLASPTERLYARMEPEVREIRDPDTDHWMAEEFRAIAYNDRARLFNARAQLSGLFERATTTEGIADDSGAWATGTGGTLISRPVEQLILIAKEKVSKMPMFASTFTMTKLSHTVPTGAAMTAYQTAEGGTTTQGEPTYSAVTLRAVKAAARGIVTLEMLDDSDVNVVNFMTTRAGMALGALQEAQYWRTGDDTEPNISAFAAGTTYTPATTATALDFTSVIDCYYTCPQVYRGSAAWYAEASVLQALMGVRDGNGRAFYQGLMERPAPITDDPGAVGTLMNRPVYEVDATAGTIHFGDMNALYIIGTRAGIQARMSEHVGFATGTVQFIWEQRYDGNNVDTSAVQTMTGITSANSL